MAAPLDPARPVRWGILGAGNIASTVGADIAASEHSEIVAVGARDAGRAADFASRRGIPRSYGSYAELVADTDIDVVYIATTHAQHLEHALLTLRAGKPALVEKAFALNARQAGEVVAEARARELFCMEAMWMRLSPLIVSAREIAASGRIGDLIGVRADLSKRFDYDPGHRLFDLAAGGGALLDLGVYPVNFAWIVLGRPDTVQATGGLSPTGSDATAALQWGYADGRFAQIQSSALGDNPYTALITGTEGWIQIEPRLHRPKTITIGTANDREVISGDLPGNGYGPEVTEVERCLRAGETESPLVPLDDTVAILDLLDDARAQIGVRYPADEG
jgi:predicted dehydrogenase